MVKEKEVALLITTAHRGVFFGYGVPNEGKVIKIKNAQMCIYWSQDVKGVFGLAAHGPSKSCKVGPIVTSMTIQDVTAITECTEEAEKKWKEQPWA